MVGIDHTRYAIAWRVEASFSLRCSFFGGICKLHSICADASPHTTKCHVKGKAIKHSAAVHTAPRLAMCIPPLGMAYVNQQRSSEPEMVCHRVSRPARNNDIICLQETHGKSEFLQAVQVLLPQFRLFGTFTLNNVNAGGSAIFTHKNLLPDGAIVSHMTTCQGSDHIVTIRSGEGVLVVINIHFETFPGIEGSTPKTTPYFPSLASLCDYWPHQYL